MKKKTKGTIGQLAAYIAQREPGLRGFLPENLWRMRQFFETYRDDPKLSPLLRVLPWSSRTLEEISANILAIGKEAEGLLDGLLNVGAKP